MSKYEPPEVNEAEELKQRSTKICAQATALLATNKPSDEDYEKLLDLSSEAELALCDYDMQGANEAFDKMQKIINRYP